MQPETTVWNRCVRDLQAELPEQQFNTWIRPLQAVEDGPVLKLLAPNRFVVDWLNQHYLGRIEELLGGTGEVVVEVGSRQGGMQPAITAARPAPAESAPPIVSRLNPDFIFDNFVEGKSNQLARAAAFQVGENPGKSYNPLFIYGGVGLGKTHLMQAIGNAMIARNPGRPGQLRAFGAFCGRYGQGPAAQHNRGVQAVLPIAGRAADR